MGRVQVRTNDSNHVDPVVESYLRTVGLGGCQEQDDFRKRLREIHGPIGEQTLQGIAAGEEGQDADIYPLKNSTLALSIDVTSQYYNQMYRNFLDWFCRAQFPAPKSLLDVGCDNGVLTCFYATRYPAAQVVGIDRCEEGIACARELAYRLKLANVRFEVCDLRRLAGTFPEQSFDLILSTTVFHEVLGFFEDAPDSGRDEKAMKPDDPDDVRIAAALVGLLRAGTGTLVSMERCADGQILTRWIRMLGRAGLGVDADRCALLRHDNVHGERETLPVVVATRGRHPAAHSLADIHAFQNFEDCLAGN